MAHQIEKVANSGVNMDFHGPQIEKTVNSDVNLDFHALQGREDSQF